MIIKLLPIRSDTMLTLFKNGKKLTVNGEEFDFTRLADGCTLPQGSISCDSVAGDVENVGGEVILTLIMPHKAYANEASRFPRPLLNIPNGRVVLPTDYDVAPVVFSGEGESNV